MRVTWTSEFERQRRLYHFCFTCEQCSHFIPTSGLCSHGYPNCQHLNACYEDADPPAEIVFCKEFELA